MTLKLSSTNRNSSRSIDWLSRSKTKQEAEKRNVKRRISSFFASFMIKPESNKKEGRENSITNFTQTCSQLFLQNRMCLWGRKNIMLWHFSTHHTKYFLYTFFADHTSSQHRPLTLSNTQHSRRTTYMRMKEHLLAIQQHNKQTMSITPE